MCVSPCLSKCCPSFSAVGWHRLRAPPRVHRESFTLQTANTHKPAAAWLCLHHLYIHKSEVAKKPVPVFLFLFLCKCVCGRVLLMFWGHKSVYTVQLWGLIMGTKCPHNINHTILGWRLEVRADWTSGRMPRCEDTSRDFFSRAARCRSWCVWQAKLQEVMMQDTTANKNTLYILWRRGHRGSSYGAKSPAMSALCMWQTCSQEKVQSQRKRY